LNSLRVDDFRKSFASGLAFCGLVNWLRPNSIKPSGDAIADMTMSFEIAERDFAIPKLLEPEFVAADPDELSIMT
jgi:hypothetical protein